MQEEIHVEDHNQHKMQEHKTIKLMLIRKHYTAQLSSESEDGLPSLKRSKQLSVGSLYVSTLE